GVRGGVVRFGRVPGPCSAIAAIISWLRIAWPDFCRTVAAASRALSRLGLASAFPALGLAALVPLLFFELLDIPVLLVRRSHHAAGTATFSHDPDRKSTRIRGFQ